MRWCFHSWVKHIWKSQNPHYLSAGSGSASWFLKTSARPPGSPHLGYSIKDGDQSAGFWSAFLLSDSACLRICCFYSLSAQAVKHEQTLNAQVSPDCGKVWAYTSRSDLTFILSTKITIYRMADWPVLQSFTIFPHLRTWWFHKWRIMDSHKHLWVSGGHVRNTIRNWFHDYTDAIKRLLDLKTKSITLKSRFIIVLSISQKQNQRENEI